MNLPAGLSAERWGEICEREIKTLQDRCKTDETRLAELMDENERLRAVLNEIAVADCSPSCASEHVDKVRSIARAALAVKP